jgi:lipoyl(octanoyl) transferase
MGLPEFAARWTGHLLSQEDAGMLQVHALGVTDYLATWTAMRDFTATRTPDTADQLWLTQHPAVFTLGQAGDPAHILAAGDVPVIRTDRGGQVTYHGPGQLILYVLLDLGRRRIGVRPLVRMLESSVIGVLERHGIRAEGRPDAPGVYVGGAKIASLGLRVRHGRTYHGLAFNAAMELAPFLSINPCGCRDLAVTDARSLGIPDSPAQLEESLVREFTRRWADSVPPPRAPD